MSGGGEAGDPQDTRGETLTWGEERVRAGAGR